MKLRRATREEIERLRARVKGGEVHGLFFYGIPEELERPEVRRHHERVVSWYKRPGGKETLILMPIDVDVKPFTSSTLYKQLKKSNSAAHIVGYVPPLGPIPEELAETYPLSQFEAPRDFTSEVIEATAKVIAEYIEKQGYKTITVYYDKGDWSERLTRILVELLKGKRIELRQVGGEDEAAEGNEGRD